MQPQSSSQSLKRPANETYAQPHDRIKFPHNLFKIHLIISCHIRLNHHSGLSPSDVPTKILHIISDSVFAIEWAYRTWCLQHTVALPKLCSQYRVALPTLSSQYRVALPKLCSQYRVALPTLRLQHTVALPTLCCSTRWRYRTRCCSTGCRYPTLFAVRSGVTVHGVLSTQRMSSHACVYCSGRTVTVTCCTAQHAVLQQHSCNTQRSTIHSYRSATLSNIT
jgi:hypothetical protein